MSVKGEKYSSPSAMKKHEGSEGAKERMKEYGKKAPLGSGKRFAAVAASAKKGGAKNPAAVAAAVGMKKYGVKKMTKMAQAGKRRAAKGK